MKRSKGRKRSRRGKWKRRRKKEETNFINIYTYIVFLNIRTYLVFVYDGFVLKKNIFDILTTVCKRPSARQHLILKLKSELQFFISLKSF